MASIQYRRTLSDCAVDGYIPETVRIDQNTLLRKSREALERWIERVGEEGLLAIERERLTVPLPPDIRRTAQARHGDFTKLNNRWGTSRSDTTHAFGRILRSGTCTIPSTEKPARAGPNFPPSTLHRIFGAVPTSR